MTETEIGSSSFFIKVTLGKIRYRETNIKIGKYDGFSKPHVEGKIEREAIYTAATQIDRLERYRINTSSPLRVFFKRPATVKKAENFINYLIVLKRAIFNQFGWDKIGGLTQEEVDHINDAVDERFSNARTNYTAVTGPAIIPWAKKVKIKTVENPRYLKVDDAKKQQNQRNGKSIESKLTNTDSN